MISIPSTQCRKFSREFKLAVINWARDNEASVEETAEKFQLARKRLREWMNEEKRIRSARYGKQSKYSDVERAATRRRRASTRWGTSTACRRRLSGIGFTMRIECVGVGI